MKGPLLAPMIAAALGAPACSLLMPFDDYTSGGTVELERDLVGHWRFEEGRDLVAGDSSGQKNDGILGKDTHWATGKLGGALSFDQGAPHVEVKSSPSLARTNAVSVAAWAYAITWCGTSGSSIARRVLQRSEDGMQYRLLCEGNKLMWDAGGARAIGEELPMPGQWHHVAGTFDGTTARLYVDGAQVGAAPAVAPLMTTKADPLYIGAKNPWGFFFHGRLDEVLLYARALSAEEVRALSMGQLPGARR